MNQQPFILIVTGITTAGKTTLLKNLKRQSKALKGVHIHDMDENGTPDAGRNHWRLYRVEELLYDAKKRYEKGESSVICGVIYPHEIIASENFDAKLNLHYLLLENSLAVFSERVDAKMAKNAKYTYLKSHKKDFVQARNQLRNEVITQLRHFVIDGGKLSAKAVTKQTLEIIDQIS